VVVWKSSQEVEHTALRRSLHPWLDALLLSLLSPRKLRE
jgi:hypothetical protein